MRDPFETDPNGAPPAQWQTIPPDARRPWQNGPDTPGTGRAGRKPSFDEEDGAYCREQCPWPDTPPRWCGQEPEQCRERHLRQQARQARKKGKHGKTKQRKEQPQESMKGD